jgi:Bacterial Ig-like domain/LysM domain
MPGKPGYARLTLIALAVIALLGAGLWNLYGPSTPATSNTARTLPQPAKIGTTSGPSFDVVRINPSGDTVMAGRATPGAEVIIRQGGKEVGRTRADDRGEWVFLPSEPLAAGARELTLSERNGDGPEIAGSGSVLLMVPERMPPGSIAQNPLAVLTNPNGTSRVLQGAGKRAPGALGLDAVDYDDQGQLRFSGGAEPGARVRLHVDGRIAGETVTDASGSWTLTPPASVTPGSHQLHLERLGTDGQVAEQADYPFQRDTLTAKELAEGKMIVRPGHSLWMLARSRYGEGARYTVIYDANRDRLKDPGKIYPGQVLSLPPEARSGPEARPNLAVGR